MAKAKGHLNSAWVSTKSAANALGCTAQHLRRLREDNFFKQGEHWRDISRQGAARPTYRWHVKHCSELLEKARKQCP
jgi:hypothetical protein